MKIKTMITKRQAVMYQAETYGHVPRLPVHFIVVLSLMLTLLVTPLLALLPVQAQTTTTQYLNGKIMFQTDREGTIQVYIMNPDGSDPANLINNPAVNYSARWSTDGTKVAFSTLRDGNFEIYTMNADGSNQTRLTNVTQSDYSPSWSPDGTKISFTSGRNGIVDQVYTMNADGSNVVQLTNNSAGSSASDWSPDGTKVIFKSNQTGDFELYSIDANGTNQVNLTNNAAADQGAHWSPDGTKIAFWSNRDGNPEIYTMNADGSNVVRLTNNSFDERSPGWSPDGTKILFNSNRHTGSPSGPWEIYSMNVDGSNPTRLTFTTPSTASSYSADWQPLPYTVTTNDDGSKVSTIASSQNYPTTDYTVASNETLTLDGTLCDVTVSSGATLQGTGHACTITVNPGGTISPGHSPGCITSGNLSLSGTYTAQLGGTTPCSGYDQLQVTGTVTVGGTVTPSLVNNFLPKIGDSFTIVTNDSTDPVSGTFSGLPEGSTITAGGVIYKLSYVGGDGNDITLTALNTLAVPNTGLSLVTGHPLLTMLATIIAAGVLLKLARRQRTTWLTK